KPNGVVAPAAPVFPPTPRSSFSLLPLPAPPRSTHSQPFSAIGSSGEPLHGASGFSDSAAVLYFNFTPSPTGYSCNFGLNEITAWASCWKSPVSALISADHPPVSSLPEASSFSLPPSPD